MQKWSAQDAKVHFSEFLDTCIAKGLQMITEQGTETAVLVPVDLWHKLQANSRPSLKQLLLSDVGRTDLVLPDRGQARRRSVQEME